MKSENGVRQGGSYVVGKDGKPKLVTRTEGQPIEAPAPIVKADVPVPADASAKPTKPQAAPAAITAKEQ